jgi:undecaprenyl-diphosphatase
MGFTNLTVPVAADAAIQVRFLHKNGLDIPSAAATGGVLSSVTEIAAQAALFVVAVQLAPDSLEFGHIDTPTIALMFVALIVAAVAVAAVVLNVERAHRAVVPHVVRAARSVWHAITSPTRLALLLFGNVTTEFIAAAALLACIHAFDASINFWTLLAINIGVGLLASIVPIPGGGTAVSAIGLVGMLTATGMPQPTAVAAVLAYQLVHSYLPAVPGWFATRHLLRTGYL